LQRNWWGAKTDLKDAYFHLPRSQDFKPYIRIMVGGEFGNFKQHVLA